jgi:ABC-type ATPase involved in cell division
VFVATHDVDLIRRMGKRVLTLEKGKLRERDMARETLAREAPFLPGS